MKGGERSETTAFFLCCSLLVGCSFARNIRCESTGAAVDGQTVIACEEWLEVRRN